MHGLISNFCTYMSRDQEKQGILPLFFCQMKTVQPHFHNKIKKTLNNFSYLGLQEQTKCHRPALNMPILLSNTTAGSSALDLQQLL